MNSLSADDIIKSLETKSAKIRALAAAGFERADIARYLGIRYQHVRNVLLQSTGPTPPRAKHPKPIAVTPPLLTADLLSSGFVGYGKWILNNDDITLSEEFPRNPAVYAFVENGVVVYIGVASRDVLQRFKFYIKPGPRQSTSIRLKSMIIDKLKSGRDIEIYLAQPAHSYWNEQPVDTVVGLEAGLIARYKPAWNKKGK